jgi:hypothetical protein
MTNLLLTTKSRWFTSTILAMTAIGITTGLFLSKPHPVSAAPDFVTYVTGNFTFSTPVEMVKSHSPIFFQQDAEPEIHTDIFGNIYVSAINGVPGGTDLWKSIDGGATFPYLGEPDGTQDHCATLPQCAGLGGGDDSTDVSSDGYLYVSSLWIGNVTVSTSMDGGTGGVLPGQAWQVHPTAASVVADDRMWVAAYGPQTLNMTYRQAPGTGDLFFVKSTDAGKTFGAPVLVRSGDSTEGNLVVDTYNGNLYTSTIPSNATNQIKLLKSTDGGATWSETLAYTAPAGSDPAHKFTILAVDRGGNLYLVFSQSNADGSYHVYLTTSTNQGASWSTAVRVDNGTGTSTYGVMPWVVAGSPGVVDITWLGSSTSPNTFPSAWYVFFAQVTNALSGSPTIAQNQVLSKSIHDQDICFNGSGCAANPRQSPGNRDLLEYYTMTLDQNGNANIAYPDSLTADCPANTCETNTWFSKQTGGSSAYAPPAPPAPATFAANLAIPGSGGAAEPSLAVDSHNCIYGSAPGTYFFRSTDGGLSFTAPPPPPVLGGGDEDVATIALQTGARNDSLYYADLAVADVGIYKSTDRGTTWTSPGTGGVAGNFDVSSDRQWIWGDRINGGANQILWELDHEFTTEQVRISASIDDSPWGTTTAEVDPTLNAGSTPNTNPGRVFVDYTTHNMHGVFAASNPTTNGIEGGFGKEPDYWEVIASPPAAAGLPPSNVADYPIVKGLIDSPSTAPAGTTTYGTHIGAIFPAAAADNAGNIYAVWSTCSARPNASIPPGTNNATTYDIWFASSHDHGQTFYGPFKISSGHGTSVFPWIDAGDDGRVDVVWYQSANASPPLVSDPSTPATLTGGPNQMPAGSTWTVVFAQSLNAASREPVFTLSTASDHIIHTGSISIGGTFGNSDRSLLDYFKVAIGPDGLANIMCADNGTSGLHINYMRQNGGLLALTNPSAVTCLPVPPLTSVVSRKTHGSLTPPPAGPGDLTLNLNPNSAATIEPRSGGNPNGSHTLVFTFLNTLNATTPVTSIMATARTSSGTQNVTATGSLGTDPHQYFVSLPSVPNASHLVVTLHGVTDTAGNSGDIAPVRMDVLWGDVNQDPRTDNGDAIVIRNQSGNLANSSNFLADVNISGRIDNGDAIVVRNNSGMALPP